MKQALAALAGATVITLTIATMSIEAQAGAILLVNGAAESTEPGTTAAVTSNFITLEGNVGNSVVVSDSLPANFASYAQIWDVRWFSPLTATETSDYLSFLQGGGGLFVMGENSGFLARNNSIATLISDAGGGSINPTGNFEGNPYTETVLPPFTGPNPIPGNQITFAAPGQMLNSGTGQFMTSDPAGGAAGAAFAQGTLADALTGSLTTVFDVNFMENQFFQDLSQPFEENLIGFVSSQAPPGTVPEPTSLVLIGTALAGFGLARRPRKAA
jgi:hypothetical protein